MGVYIPNMSKPKECKECQWHLDFYIEDEQVGGLCTITEKDDKEYTCPLIEIVTCGECKWSYIDERDGLLWCKIHMSHYRVNDDGFCNYVERGADEGTTE